MHSEIDKRFMHLLRIAWHDRIGICESSVRCTQRASFRFPGWLRANARLRSIRPRREIRAEAARKIASGSKDIPATRRRGKWNLRRVNHARFSRNSKCKILHGTVPMLRRAHRYEKMIRYISLENSLTFQLSHIVLRSSNLKIVIAIIFFPSETQRVSS